MADINLKGLNRKLMGMIKDQVKHNKDIESRKMGLQEESYEQSVQWAQEDRRRRQTWEDAAFAHQKRMYSLEHQGGMQMLQGNQYHLGQDSPNQSSQLNTNKIQQYRSFLDTASDRTPDQSSDYEYEPPASPRTQSTRSQSKSKSKSRRATSQPKPLGTSDNSRSKDQSGYSGYVRRDSGVTAMSDSGDNVSMTTEEFRKKKKKGLFDPDPSDFGINRRY